MLKLNPSQEVAGGAPEFQRSIVNTETNSSAQVNHNELEGDVVNKRSGNRKDDRYDTGRYEDMSDDASASSGAGRQTTARKSRRIQPTDAQDYDGGMSDCSHCRRQKRMAKARRNRSKKSRSRSRRRRR